MVREANPTDQPNFSPYRLVPGVSLIRKAVDRNGTGLVPGLSRGAPVSEQKGRNSKERQERSSEFSYSRLPLESVPHTPKILLTEEVQVAA